jgi:CRP-like cAMP-binding protein
MISPEERLQFLAGIPIFAGVHTEALSALAEQTTEITVLAGKLVFREKDPGSEMFVVRSGSVEVIKHLGEDHESKLAVLGPKDFVGEMAIIECAARSASVCAAKESVLFRIKSSQLHALFQHHPDQYSIVILNIARDLSRRLRALDENWSEASRWRSLDEAMIRAMEA